MFNSSTGRLNRRDDNPVEGTSITSGGNDLKASSSSNRNNAYSGSTSSNGAKEDDIGGENVRNSNIFCCICGKDI